jgi:hypothetical protein
MNNGYFKTSDGLKVYYTDIERAIDVLHPRFRDRHIYDQLKVLGLFDIFLQGQASCSLPRTFTGCSVSTSVAAA